MRRLLGTIGVGLAVTGSLAGQSRLSLGVNLGYTISDFSGPAASGVETRTGATAGAFLQVPLSAWLAVQPGLAISSRGGTTLVSPTGGGSPVRFDLELVYFEVPVLLRARIPIPGRLRLVLTGGGAAGLRIGCNLEISAGGASLLREACGDVTTTEFRAWDLAWVVGGGLGIPIERSELTLQVRLTQSVRALSADDDFYNRAVSFLVSVPF